MHGYEIHLGITRGPALDKPLVLRDDQRTDGAISNDGQLLGSYCHGIFDHPDALVALLEWAGMRPSERIDFAARREQDIERLADAVEATLDVERLGLSG